MIHKITIFADDKHFCTINLTVPLDVNRCKLKNIIKRIASLILNKKIEIDLVYEERNN